MLSASLAKLSTPVPVQHQKESKGRLNSFQ